MEQQKQKNEELQKKLQETAALQDPWDRFAASCEGISLNVLLFSRFLRNHLNHILRHDVSFWKAQTPSSLFSTYIMCYQLVKWLLLWQEEVAKKRDRRLAEETAGSLCNAGWFLAIDSSGRYNNILQGRVRPSSLMSVVSIG